MEVSACRDFTGVRRALVGVDAAASSSSRSELADTESCDFCARVVGARVQVIAVRVRFATISNHGVSALAVLTEVFGATV